MLPTAARLGSNADVKQRTKGKKRRQSRVAAEAKELPTSPSQSSEAVCHDTPFYHPPEAWTKALLHTELADKLRELKRGCQAYCQNPECELEGLIQPVWSTHRHGAYCSVRRHRVGVHRLKLKKYGHRSCTAALATRSHQKVKSYQLNSTNNRKEVTYMGSLSLPWEQKVVPGLLELACQVELNTGTCVWSVGASVCVCVCVET